MHTSRLSSARVHHKAAKSPLVDAEKEREEDALGSPQSPVVSADSPWPGEEEGTQRTSGTTGTTSSKSFLVRLGSFYFIF